MQLLVSVANPAEASAALAGGADLIDAKDPSEGALGAVPLGILREIHHVVSPARPVTAALGDAVDEDIVERSARQFAAAGAAFVKVGFAGIAGRARIEALVGAAVRGTAASARQAGVIAVSYADAHRDSSISRYSLIEVATRAGARGLLLDTADKQGPGLCGLVAPAALAAWVAEAHAAGLLVALAGRLTASDLSIVREAGADIAGVRGAACQGGRSGRVNADKVRLLRFYCNPRTLSTPLLSTDRS